MCVYLCQRDLQLLSASKGDELWTSSLEDAAADASRKLVVAQDDSLVSLVAFTPG